MLNIYLNVFHSCFIQCAQCDCWHYMDKHLRWQSCTNDTESIWNDPFYETTTRRGVTVVSESQDYLHNLTIVPQSQAHLRRLTSQVFNSYCSSLNHLYTVAKFCLYTLTLPLPPALPQAQGTNHYGSKSLELFPAVVVKLSPARCQAPPD